MDNKDYNYLIKFSFLGDINTGKSTIRSWYCSQHKHLGRFPNFPLIDMQTKIIKRESLTIKARIFDIVSGQESYMKPSLAYYRGNNGLIIVFDVTDRLSFTNVDTWINEIKNKLGDKKVHTILIGNKTDLIDKRQVYREEAEKKAKDNDMKYYETNIINDETITNALNEFIDEIISSLINKKKLSIILNKTKKKQNKSCGK